MTLQKIRNRKIQQTGAEDFVEKLEDSLRLSLPTVSHYLINQVKDKFFVVKIRLQYLKQLLADTEAGNDSTIALDVCLDEVIEQTLSLTYHLKKAASGMVVVLVLLEMLGEVVDSLGENGDLDFGRTCVTLVKSVLLDNGFFFCFQHVKTPLK